MKKLSIVLLSAFVLAACSSEEGNQKISEPLDEVIEVENEDVVSEDNAKEVDETIDTKGNGEEEISNKAEENDEGLVVDDGKTDSERAIEEVGEENKDKALHAVNAVRDLLGIEEQSPTKVVFDHKENEHYIIHVFDVVDMGEAGLHNATVGWYSFNDETKEIEPLF